MACYIINYDLNKTKDYESLITQIKTYDTWAKILKSCWAVVTPKTAAEVFDHLRSHMDGDDGLFVVKSGTASKWVNVECSNEWLQKNL